jgi:DNA-binding IclR family transcriptional regulator
MTLSAETEHGSWGVIGKAFALLTVLQSTNGAMRLSDLSRKTGLPKSTTHRMLNAMLTSEVVVRIGTGYQATRHATTDLAGSYRTLQRELAPYLGDVLMRTGLTASLAVLAETDVIYLRRVHGHDDTWGSSDDSGRGCAYISAAGRLLMAFDRAAARRIVEARQLNSDDAGHLYRELDQIRRDRCAIRTSASTTCVAVPLPGVRTYPRPALVAKGLTRRMNPGHVVYWLRRIADEASDRLLAFS